MSNKKNMFPYSPGDLVRTKYVGADKQNHPEFYYGLVISTDDTVAEIFYFDDKKIWKEWSDKLAKSEKISK